MGYLKKREDIINQIDGNADELVKINEYKINYRNNEIIGIEENKKN